MSHKKRGQITTSPEWARHLRPFLRRCFWKGERRAASELVRAEASAPADRIETGAVEDLIQQVGSWSPDSTVAELWVAKHLTFHGEPVEQDIAMAIVGDKVLSFGYFPGGFSASTGGRLYRYNRE